MQDLKVTAIQASLHWHNAEANRKMFDDMMPGKGETDLIILPEMFTTGFSMEAKSVAEKPNGDTIAWMLAHAANLQAVVIGSLIIVDKGQYYNRLIIATPDGKTQHYDKRHLFRMAGEDKHYTSGKLKVIVPIKGWKVCPMICYDLRFPVWSRNQNNYDLLIYVANWPTPRKNAWSTLLMARAIENHAYVIGVNRIGRDENGHTYSGDSAVIDMLGKSLWQGESLESVGSVSLSMDVLLETRRKFPWHLDADAFELKL